MVILSIHLLKREINDRLIVHLQYGIKRIVIFNIDLHHGLWLKLRISYFLILSLGNRTLFGKLMRRHTGKLLKGKTKGLFLGKDLRYSMALSMIFFHIHVRWILISSWVVRIQISFKDGKASWYIVRTGT